MTTKVLRYVFVGKDDLSRTTKNMARNVNGSNKEIERSTASLGKSLKKDSATFGNLAGAVTGFGDAQTAASKKSGMFRKVLAGVNLATGVLEPALAGVTVAAGGLAAGFAAAAGGAMVFGAVAGAVMATASQAADKATTASDTYKASVFGITATYRQQMGVATTRAQKLAAQSTREAALQTALAAKVKATHAAYMGLSPQQVMLAKAILRAKQQWQSFIKLATPGVAGTMKKAFGVLPQIFKIMGPFMAPVESALNSIIGKVKTGLASPFWTKFFGLMAKTGGPVMQTLAAAAGNVAHGIAGILSAFMPMEGQMTGGIEKLTAKFAKWGAGLSGGSGFASLMTMFKTETPKAMAILKNLGTTLINVGKSMTGLSGVGNSNALLQMLLPLSSVLATISKNQALSRLILYMIALHGVTSKLKPVFGGLQSSMDFLKGAWKGVVKFSLATEGATAAEVISTAATRAWGLAMKALPFVAIAALVIMVALIVIKYHKQIWAFAKMVWGKVLQFIKACWHWVQKNWPLLLAIITGPIGLATLFVIKHFRQIREFVAAVISTIQRIWSAGFEAVKGFVRTFLNVILGVFGAIIHGAASAFGWVPGIGGKLHGAADAFDRFRDRVNKSLGGVKDQVATLALKWGLRNQGPPGFARGGPVHGPGTSASDSIPARLSSGEYVIRASAHNRYGTHFLDTVNTERFAGGGAVGRGLNVRASLPAMATVDSSIANIVATMAHTIAKKIAEGNGSNILRYALGFKGSPYVWGGTEPGHWDCSGMTSFVYKHFGYHDIPRVSQDQQRWAQPSRNTPGALVFFGNPAYHVGLSMGNGNMFSALGHAYGTIVSSLSGNSGFGVPPGGFRSQSFDKGGRLRPGYTLAYNGTGRDEYVSGHGGGTTVIVQPKAVIGTKDELARHLCDVLARYENHGGKVPWKRGTK